MVCDKLHDYFDHVSVWQQTQKLADEAAVPYGIIGCSEINKQCRPSSSPRNSSLCPESTK